MNSSLRNGFAFIDMVILPQKRGSILLYVRKFVSSAQKIPFCANKEQNGLSKKKRRKQKWEAAASEPFGNFGHMAAVGAAAAADNFQSAGVAQGYDILGEA